MLGEQLPLGTIPWSIHPHPKLDETFDSWIIRFAVANDISVSRLFSILKGKKATGSLTMDYKEFFNPLAMVSGLTIVDLMYMDTASLVDSDKYITDWRSGKNLRAPFYRSCPLCIHNDSVPYIRQTWQRKYSFLCETHRTLLVLYCHRCGAPARIPILKPKSVLRSRSLLLSCQRCDASTADSPESKLPECHPVFWLQRELLGNKFKYWVELPSGRRISRALLHFYVESHVGETIRRALREFSLERYTSSPSRVRSGVWSASILAGLLSLNPDRARIFINDIAELILTNTALRSEYAFFASRFMEDYIKVLLLTILLYRSDVNTIDLNTVHSYKFDSYLKSYFESCWLREMIIEMQNEIFSI